MGYKLRTSAFTDCGVATTRIRPSEARHVSHLIRAATDDYKTRAYRNLSLNNRSGLFGNLIVVAWRAKRLAINDGQTGTEGFARFINACRGELIITKGVSGIRRKV